MNTDQRMVSGVGYSTGKEIVKIRMAVPGSPKLSAFRKGESNVWKRILHSDWLDSEDITCLRDIKLDADLLTEEIGECMMDRQGRKGERRAGEEGAGERERRAAEGQGRRGAEAER